ncbi:hypothetical protein TanjilG_20845 [Lupinus angustifolius]|uniref:Uncharacterized protein n=1 Tax=Lupinus angustifolius TaxID=3871 RepID=A0A4P1QRX0_LUPAN|nr:hypothetical protein TanjilG_20845 [Lupinus angustifolius]
MKKVKKCSALSLYLALLREKIEATELARPTTIPTLTCPLFGIGRPEHLIGMLLLPPFIIPLPLTHFLVISFFVMFFFASVKRTRIQEIF